MPESHSYRNGRGLFQILLVAAQRALAGSVTLYSGGLVILTVLWMLQPQRFWWLALSNVFAVLLFLPLVPLVPLVLVLRSTLLRRAGLVMLVTFLALFGAQIVPARPVPAAGAPLRVVTFNQLFSNERVSAVIAAIRAQKADLVALQEVSRALARAARQQLSAEYPYQFVVPGAGDAGLGILSRYPLASTVQERDFAGQRVTVDVQGRQLTLINVHLPAPAARVQRIGWRISLPVIRDYNTARRAYYMRALLARIDQTDGPLIVLGDFNTSDREPPYAELASRMHDAYRETAWGFGYTFPSNAGVGTASSPFPLVRIDYVWSRGGIVPAAARVDCSGGSDHCMVVADLALAG